MNPREEGGTRFELRLYSLLCSSTTGANGTVVVMAIGWSVAE